MKKKHGFTVIDGSAGKKRGNGKYRKLLLTVIVLAVAVPAARGLLAYSRGVMSALLVKTVVAEEGVLDITVTTEGLVVREEHLAAAPVSGTLEWLVSGGERVAADVPVARINTPVGQVQVTAPVPGILVKSLDGLEGLLSGTNLSQMEVTAVRELSPAPKTIAAGSRVSQGSLLFKVVNNFLWHILLDLSPEEALLLESGDSHMLRFSCGSELPGRVVLRRNEEKGRTTLAYQLDADIADALQERFITASVLVSRLRGIVLPASALICREGEAGVYIVQKSVVRFRQVEVVGEFGDMAAIRGLAEGLRVVVNPALVKEGQRL
jgi:putative membrane fusion protein